MGIVSYIPLFFLENVTTNNFFRILFVECNRVESCERSNCCNIGDILILGGIDMNDLKDKLNQVTHNVKKTADKAHSATDDALNKADAMNDKVKGQFNQTKGDIKTNIGNLTDNEKLRNEGRSDNLKGSVQEISGLLKEAAHDIKKDWKK